MWYIVITILIVQTTALQRVDPLVSTPKGLIRGLKAQDGGYSMFLGIPYGVVNESNPFGISSPEPNFEDTFNAYDDSIVCPQSYGDIIGHIDCLKLNIYVPDNANSYNRLPVMIWIHGGAFVAGSGSKDLFGPKFLVEKGVILVTINYRLGLYGFMCTEIPQVSGNQGLKDQVLALQWVKENIASFGGNNNDITLFGESAGGMSIDLLLLFKNDNLFNKVIVQSGTAISPWTLTEPDNDVPLQLAKQLGFETVDIENALQFLATVDPHLVIAAGHSLGLTTLGDISVLKIRPCVEKTIENQNALITDYPNNVKLTDKIPILIGVTSNEMIMRYEQQSDDFFKDYSFDSLLYGFNFTNDFRENIELIKQFYTADDEITAELKYSIIDYASDVIFVYPNQRTVDRYVKNGANVYQYVFSYEGNRRLYDYGVDLQGPGATHADDLAYLFDFNSEEISEDDLVMIDIMTTLWTNFAKYGNPTPETTDLLQIKWPMVSLEKQYYLDINSELKIGTRPFHTRMAFWEAFYRLNREYEKGYNMGS